MGKKVCVEIKFHRIIEKDIELPEGKSVDDIFWCIGGGNRVSIEFLGDDGNTNPPIGFGASNTIWFSTEPENG